MRQLESWKGERRKGKRGWGLGAITRKREAFGAGRRSISLCEGKELKARVALEKRRKKRGVRCAPLLLFGYCLAIAQLSIGSNFQLFNSLLTPQPLTLHASHLTLLRQCAAVDYDGGTGGV